MPDSARDKLISLGYVVDTAQIKHCAQINEANVNRDNRTNSAGAPQLCSARKILYVSEN